MRAKYLFEISKEFKDPQQSRQFLSHALAAARLISNPARQIQSLEPYRSCNGRKVFNPVWY